MMFNLSVFDCLTKEEREIYNQYREINKSDEKQKTKEELLNSVSSYPDVREIAKKSLFYKNNFKPITL